MDNLAPITGDPDVPTKKYVDDGLAAKAPLTGGGTSGTWPISVSGNSGTATKLATARTISLAGDATGSAAFDGSANAAITVTVVDDSHNHVIGNVDGLQTALDGKAPTSHSHTIANVTGLQTALDGKAPTSHSHTIANVTGLQTALDGKAPTSHNHAATQITSGVLDIGRVPTGTTATTVALGNHLHTGVYDPAGSAAARVAKAGDTMTGALTLSGAPTADLHASSKKYVDDNTPDYFITELPPETGAKQGDFWISQVTP